MPIANLHLAEKTVSECKRIIGIDINEAAILGGGVFVTAQSKQRRGAIEAGFSEIRVEPHGAVEAEYRVLVTHQPLQGRAAQQIGVGGRRIDLDRLAHEILGFLPLPALAMQKSQSAQRLVIARIGANDVAVEMGRLLKIACAMKTPSLV